jgi:hypothetical protein
MNMEYRVIKENDLFLLTDLAGDIPEGQTQGFGLYAKDTRFLSRMERPVFARIRGRNHQHRHVAGTDGNIRHTACLSF